MFPKRECSPEVARNPTFFFNSSRKPVENNEQRFVEGYVRERRRYLDRRVSAQREGHGGFKREDGAGVAGGRRQQRVTEASKAEFRVSKPGVNTAKR